MAPVQDSLEENCTTAPQPEKFALKPMMARWSLVAAAAAAPVWAYVSTPGASCGLCFGRDRAGRAVLLSSHLRASLSEEVAACEVGAAAQSLRRAEGVNTILPRRPNSGSAINKCPKDTRDSEKMDLFGFDVAEFNALLDGIKCRRSDSLEHRLLGDEEGHRANRMVLTRFDAAEINALFDDIKSRSLDSLERRLFVLLGDKPTDGLDTFAFPEDSVVPTRPPVVASFSKAGREHRRPKVNQDFRESASTGRPPPQNKVAPSRCAP